MRQPTNNRNPIALNNRNSVASNNRNFIAQALPASPLGFCPL